MTSRIFLLATAAAAEAYAATIRENVFLDAVAQGQVSTEAQNDAPQPEAPKRGRPRKNADASSATIPSSAEGATPGASSNTSDSGQTAPTSASPSDTGPGTPDHTFDEVKAAVLKCSQEVGRDAAVEILARFKNPANGKPATRASELAEADWDACYEACNAALEAAGDLG